MLRCTLIVPALALSLAAAGCMDMETSFPPPTPDDDPAPAGADAGAVADEPDAEPVPTDAEPYAELSGCMTLANWETAQMGSWANKPTEGGTVCSSCHGDGLARFHTDADPASMFQYNRYEVFITGFFTLEVDAGEVVVVPALDKLMLKGAGEGSHPTYITGPGDVYFQRLQQFYDLTMATKAAGGCGPAEFPPL